MKRKVKNSLLIGLFGLLTIGAFSVLSKGLNDWINSSSSSSTNYSSSSSISSSISSNTSILSSSTSSTSEKNNTSSSNVSVEDNVLQVGTYKFIDTPNCDSMSYTTNNDWDTFTYELKFKSNDKSFKGIGITGIDSYVPTTPFYVYSKNNGWFFDNSDGWGIRGNEYQTIEIESEQQVSQEFYTWFKANTLMVYTLPTLDVKAENYSVSQGDIAVKEDIYNAITKLNNGGSLTDFGNSCGLTIPNTMKPFYKMGARLINTYLSNQKNEVSVHAPEIGTCYDITLTIENLDKEKSNNVHLLEFDYSNNTANYVSIDSERVDVENHCVTFLLSKNDGSLLTLLCYEDSNSQINLANGITYYEYYDSINSHVSVSAGGNIESIDLESISVNDLSSYTEKVKNVIYLFNNDDGELPEGYMSFINKELNGNEDNFITTSNCGTMINLTKYEMVNAFVKFKIVGNPTNAIQFSVENSLLNDCNKDDLIAIVINKSGSVEFLELDDYDPEIGECTITSSLIQDYSIIIFALKVGDSTISQDMYVKNVDIINEDMTIHNAKFIFNNIDDLSEITSQFKTDLEIKELTNFDSLTIEQINEIVENSESKLQIPYFIELELLGDLSEGFTSSTQLTISYLRNSSENKKIAVFSVFNGQKDELENYVHEDYVCSTETLENGDFTINIEPELLSALNDSVTFSLTILEIID